jgi:CRISPR/Cas system CSM-associated protein Csm4 (group 5 of RAMP superfamily)
MRNSLSESEFRMVGQNLSIDLEPGEKLETFIPSDEEATSLSGDLVWRVQFRKGYNPSSKRGVTTLIDVRFNSRDVKDERGA